MPMCAFEEKSSAFKSGKALEMCANIDDMTAEDMSAAMEILLDAGALDVWFEHIQMKKKPPRGKAVAAGAPGG